MILLDTNILMYAYHQDAPKHVEAKKHLDEILNSYKCLVLTSWTLAAFMRILSHRKIFQEPVPIEELLKFIQALLSHPNVRVIEPAESFWKIFPQLIVESGSKSNLITGAVLASLAIEHGCELHSYDRDFLRFQGLRLQLL